MTSNGHLLDVKNLKVWFGSDAGPIRAVDGVSFSVPAGETVALVGESGCGKSVTALSLARLIQSPPAKYAEGTIDFRGEDVLTMPEKRLADLRGKEISYIFQEPGTALNPVFRVGYQIMEAIKLHRRDVDAMTECIGLVDMVGLPEAARKIRAYPHELSGGMQQRAMIAMALACRPKLLIADEPTTALDVTIQAQILELLKNLQSQLHMAILLITHNLGLVADAAHYVNVMYAGRIVETGSAEDVLTSPAHPYTRGLLDAVPRIERDKAQVRGIDGVVPNPARLPEGCKFWPRCSRCGDICRTEEPVMKPCGRPGKSVRCHFPLERA